MNYLDNQAIKYYNVNKKIIHKEYSYNYHFNFPFSKLSNAFSPSIILKLLFLSL